MRLRRPRRLLAAAPLLAAVLLAGCGGAAGGDADTAGATGDRAVRFAACMRAHGVPDFPDPVDGRIQLRAEKGSDLDPASAGFKKAQETCKQYEPAD